jgi:hypothetical protein
MYQERKNVYIHWLVVVKIKSFPPNISVIFIAIFTPSCLCVSLYNITNKLGIQFFVTGNQSRSESVARVR